MACQVYLDFLNSRVACGKPATYQIDCEPAGPQVIIDVCDEHAIARLKARDFAYIYPVEEEPAIYDETQREEDRQEARLLRWEASREEW